MIPAYGSTTQISPVFVMLLGAGSLLTLYFVYSTFKRLRHARWVEDTPTSRIRSAAQGLVELKGSVQAGGHDPLLSPLAGTSCLWYRFTVEERRSNGKNERWVRVEHGSSERPFVLRDDTGECWINPVGAEVHPRSRRRWEGSRRWPLTSAPPRRLLGILIGGRRYRYTEEYLCADDLLYALGWFQSGGGGREIMDAQRAGRQIISAWKADYPDLLARFDRNGDGQLDQQEWQQVQAAAASEARRQISNAPMRPVICTLSKAPYSGLPFLLSDHHEENLSRRLRRQSLGSLLGMLVCGGLTGWLTLTLWQSL